MGVYYYSVVVFGVKVLTTNLHLLYRKLPKDLRKETKHMTDIERNEFLEQRLVGAPLKLVNGYKLQCFGSIGHRSTILV